MLSLGSSALDIPVGEVLYPQHVACPSGCLDRLGNATAISVRFHMHDWGRMVLLRHIRGGVELEPIAYIDNFRAKYTEFEIKVNRVLEAGDSLILDCYYTNTQNQRINFGEAINDEMCWAGILFSGQSPLNSCWNLSNMISCPSDGYSSTISFNQAEKDALYS